MHILILHSFNSINAYLLCVISVYTYSFIRPQNDHHEDSDDEEFHDFPEESDFEVHQDVESEEEFDDSDEEIHEHNDYDEPLYEGASISVGESLMAILTFSFKYKLTSACLSAMLKLILLFIPEPNLF